MDVTAFIKEHKCEILANKVRIRHEDKIVIVARLDGEEWVPTEAGAKLEHELNMRKEAAKPAAKPAAKARKKEA